MSQSSSTTGYEHGADVSSANHPRDKVPKGNPLLAKIIAVLEPLGDCGIGGENDRHAVMEPAFTTLVLRSHYQPKLDVADELLGE